MNTTVHHEGTAPRSHNFVIDHFDVENFTEHDVAKCRQGHIYEDSRAYQSIVPTHIEVGEGAFINPNSALAFPEVMLRQTESQLELSCTCEQESGYMCEHEAQVLTAVLKRDDLNIFFNRKARHEKLKKFAKDYGLDHESDLDHFFKVSYGREKPLISPRWPGLIPITKESLGAIRDLIIKDPAGTDASNASLEELSVVVVFKKHKYYKHLLVELYKGQTTKEGKLKNPLNLVNPLDFIWKTEDPHHIKFFTAVQKFQNPVHTPQSESDLNALAAIIRNPLGYSFYEHNSDVSENVTANSVQPIHIEVLTEELDLIVNRKDAFYELTGSMAMKGATFALRDLSIKFTYFIAVGDTLYLVHKLQILGLIAFLKTKPEHVLIHASQYRLFQSQLLALLEDQIHIDYRYIEPASPQQLEAEGFNKEREQIIYLSDFGSHVMLIPVLRYGEVEVPIRTRRQIYTVDHKGREFSVKRDDAAEIKFIALLIRQHPYFEEQLENDLHYFSLHKKYFLDEDWFLNTFEEWRQHQITILGFNEIQGNKLNPHKVSIDIKVSSGINWFNTQVQVRFGKKKASLKYLYKAIRNKSKYITLDDGTLGILPEHWIRKFEQYFYAGEIVDDENLQTPLVNFSAIEEYYGEEMLDEKVRTQLKMLREQLTSFEAIKEVPVPTALNATLRPYQRQGLNWLNFLDDFNFGGCLADDMGLGKSIQIIAFVLSQRTKVQQNTNLLVVPTTLIFNWQAEVEKFAPSIQILTIHGADRVKSTEGFDKYELILTSYGTLLSDVNFLKAYTFNYIFLDESQNIKNPETERYRTVRMLQSRNKIAITGTPIENNTFDLYSQLSFACPGLLGSKQYFKDIYAIPIDKFKSTQHAMALQKKVQPFMLRRSKQQVATELPDKTEMVLYCEMKAEQRKIYDAYEKEFREYISATTNEELNKSPMNVLKGLTKLRQICDAPALLGSDELYVGASAKIEMLLEQIEGKMHQHKILVFSQFVAMLDLIRNELLARKIAFSYLTGSTRNREAEVNAFQSDPKVKVFLISLKAGGTGLNLTEADYVYLVDPWWNPAVENQAIDRSHRIGQNKKVVAVRLICPDTVEDKIRLMQASKKDLAQDLVHTDTSFLKSLSKEDLLAIC